MSDVWLQTYTGKALHLLDPRPEDVCIEDIAHSLAMTTRFNGHARAFYSVAQHSWLVAWTACVLGLPRGQKKVALLHDAAEAYVGDMVSPLKRTMPEFRLAEDRVARAVGERFGVDLVHLPDEVRRADLMVLAAEARDLMAPPPRPWNLGVDPIPDEIVPLGWEAAKAKFMAEWRNL